MYVMSSRTPISANVEKCGPYGIQSGKDKGNVYKAMSIHSVINKVKAAMMGESKLVPSDRESTNFSAMMRAEHAKLCDMR